MTSVWEKTIRMPAFSPLPGDRQVDAAVIGGGMTGLLTAWFLQQRGLDTAVLEAETVASGQTGNTTAKVTAQHGLRYASLLRSHGRGKATLYAQANQWAVGAYAQLIQSLGGGCGWRELPGRLYTRRPGPVLEREYAAARAVGLPVRLLPEVPLPFPVAGALELDRQGQFHPLEFLAALAPRLTVYEHTRVLSVRGGRVETARGTVRARHVVFAVHYPFLNFPGLYFLRMHQQRSYVLALAQAQSLDAMYYGVDAPGGLSLRSAGDYLLLGGGGHRTGENPTGGQYAALRRAALEFWPESPVAGQWSAQDCIPMDGVPYIGRFSSATPHWYVATGFQKWGMTTAMVAARLLSDLITGRENPWQALFSPQRSPFPAGAPQFFEDAAQALRGLSRTLLLRPAATPRTLPPGHAALVSLGGKKAGAFRNEEASLHLVKPVCSHLGCQLEWNPEERSWDCPCHGSRFDPQGRCLSGPAQKDLKRL